METAAREQAVIDANQQARTERRKTFQSAVKSAVINAAVNTAMSALQSGAPSTPGLKEGTAPTSAGGGSIGKGGATGGVTYGYQNPGPGKMVPELDSFGNPTGKEIYQMPDYEVRGGAPSFQKKRSGPPGKMLGGSSATTNAMLSAGEFVVSKDASSAMGEDTLDSINQMRFAQGGSMGSIPRSGSSSANSKADVENINITINIDKEGNTEASTDIEGDAQRSKEFSKKVKDVVLNVINEEKRVSGSLFTRNK
jgi:hypothetical protein